MKKTLSYFLHAMLVACIVCACGDRLDIIQDYEYGIETLPLPKSLERGETVALEFSIVREGYYSETVYKFRYFQSEGKGSLTDSHGTAIPVNRFRDIPSDDFVLYYRSECEEQQQLDFVFENNLGRRVEYSIVFGNKKAEKEPEDTPENPRPEPDDETGEEPDGDEMEVDDEIELDDATILPEDEVEIDDGTTTPDPGGCGSSGEDTTPDNETEGNGDEGTKEMPDDKTGELEPGRRNGHSRA
jgi:hypothetical protein